MDLREAHVYIKTQADAFGKIDLTSYELDKMINMASLDLLRKEYLGFNQKQLAADDIQEVSDNLINHKTSISVSFTNNEIVVPPDYVYYLSTNIPCDCVNYVVHKATEENLNRKLRDPFSKPSNKWCRALRLERNGKHVYFFETTAPSSATFNYLKHRNCYDGTYILPGKTTIEPAQLNLTWPLQMQYVLLDKVVLEIKRIYAEPSFEMYREKIIG